MTRIASTEAPMEPAGFDTLAWSEMLRSSGISKKQAEMQVRVIAQAVQNGAATKADLDKVEFRLDKKIDAVANRLDKKIDAVANRLDRKIDAVANRLDKKIDAKTSDLKVDIVRWMFTLFVAQIGIMAALLKFMN